MTLASFTCHSIRPVFSSHDDPLIEYPLSIPEYCQKGWTIYSAGNISGFSHAMNMRLTGWVENKYSMSIHMWLSTNKRVYGCLLFTTSMFLMHTNKLWTEVGGNPRIILVLSSSLVFLTTKGSVWVMLKINIPILPEAFLLLQAKVDGPSFSGNV